MLPLWLLVIKSLAVTETQLFVILAVTETDYNFLKLCSSANLNLRNGKKMPKKNNFLAFENSPFGGFPKPESNFPTEQIIICVEMPQ